MDYSTISNAATRACRLGVMLSFLIASAACSTPKVLVKTDVQKQYPPPTLTQPTDLPASDIRTNGDLLNALQAARAAVDACNADKAALRDWAEEVPRPARSPP